MVLYSATGNAWMNPEVITISFMPDGTNLGGLASNLISTFNNNPYLNGRWQNLILKAAQTWAQQTNINFVVVPDDGAPSGGGDYQEGDPGHRRHPHRRLQLRHLDPGLDATSRRR